MNKIVILCVEDESEVRTAILRDLKPFAALMRIEAAEDVEDAKSVIRQCEIDEDELGLILCDHLLPGTRGVDLLIELQNDPRYRPARKVLITGQAGLEDTVRAVNEAQLQHYIAKPWNPEELQEVVRKQLTDYVLANRDDLLPFVSVLDSQRLLEAIANQRL
ncbi:MAG TPA: response regulator [Kiritimatiellia bacterium]|nr:response regulator [Kiritimatiellia bacterium]